MPRRRIEDNHLERLLRSIPESVDFPAEPDVRSAVRTRLTQRYQRVRSNDAASKTALEDAPIATRRRLRFPGVHSKSLRRQLLEMVAAVFVIVIFTGALVLIFREQASQEAVTPGGEPTEEPGDDERNADGRFFDEAVAIEYRDRSAYPYAVPESCEVTEFLGPYERDDVRGLWLVGDGIYGSPPSGTVLYEGSNLLYIQTESSVNSDSDLTVRGERLDMESDAEPYLWVQHAAGTGTHRAFLRIPEPGCWELELSTTGNDSLQATIYAYPAFERHISAANELTVHIGSAAELNLNLDDDLKQVGVGVTLQHPDLPEIEPITLTQALDHFRLEDAAGEIFAVDIDQTLELSGLESSATEREIPTGVEDGPLSLTIVFTIPDEAIGFDLLIGMPEDHPDPSMPDSYRVSIEHLLDRQSEMPAPTPTIIPSGPHPVDGHEDLSTADIRASLADDQSLAVAVQRWVDDRRIMSVIDLEGNILWDFDQIPQIEVDSFPATIVADVSPDGRSVAYQSGSSDTGSDIFVIEVGELEPMRLTDSGDNYGPVWSPDGERIAFRSHRAHDEPRLESQRSEIFVMNADGSELRQLTHTPYGAGQIKWSHDGTRIAFASPGFHSAHHLDEDDPPEFPYQLYVIDVESGDQRELRDATMEHLAGFGLSTQPWLSDNSGVLFERYGQVFLSWVDGSGVDELDGIPTDALQHQRWATASPDGEHIAFNWPQHGNGSPIGIVNLRTGESTGFAEELGTAWHSYWSPDGAYLAATKAAEGQAEAPNGLTFLDLWVVAQDDRSAEPVAKGIVSHNIRWLVVPEDASSRD